MYWKLDWRARGIKNLQGLKILNTDLHTSAWTCQTICNWNTIWLGVGTFWKVFVWFSEVASQRLTFHRKFSKVCETQIWLYYKFEPVQALIHTDNFVVVFWRNFPKDIDTLLAKFSFDVWKCYHNFMKAFWNVSPYYEYFVYNHQKNFMKSS